MGVPRQRIRLRRATQAEWASANPVLLAGEVGLETDTNRLKAGDGSLAWSALPYISGAESSLADLHDVNQAAAVNGSTLVYNASTGTWEAGPTTTTLEIVNGGNF